jgi:hypothetical protein
MSLRSKLNGTFGVADLDRMKFPVARSGTKDTAEATQEEAELGEFVDQAKAKLQSAYDQGDGKSELAIKIEAGEIVEIIEIAVRQTGFYREIYCGEIVEIIEIAV